MIRVYQYKNVTVNANQTLYASEWNGTHGGILVFDASDDVTVNGHINMTGRGFRGFQHPSTYRCARGFVGESYLGLGNGASNLVHINNNGSAGGGGGAGQDGAAGGGGGYGSAGTKGGDGSCGICHEACPIPGGASGVAVGSANLSTQVFFGGAGGEGGADEDGCHPGRGGFGGGIIFVRATRTIVATAATIQANGTVGDNGNSTCGGCGMGGGGGGAGGAIRLMTTHSASISTSRVVSTGASGGQSTCGGGPGGIGGIGRIGISSPSISGTSNPTYNSN
jgi:hypothetical protein